MLAEALSERLSVRWNDADGRLVDRVTAVVSDEGLFDPFGDVIELAGHSVSGPQASCEMARSPPELSKTEFVQHKTCSGSIPGSTSARVAIWEGIIQGNRCRVPSHVPDRLFAQARTAVNSSDRLRTGNVDRVV